MILLEIDESTMLTRLDGRQPDEWGRSGDSREYIRRLLHGYQERLRIAGAIPVDATRPLDQVVNAKLAGDDLPARYGRPRHFIAAAQTVWLLQRFSRSPKGRAALSPDLLVYH